MIEENQDPNMADNEQGTSPPIVELDGIAETFAKVKEFLEVTGFNFGGSTRNAKESPSRKAALSSWTNHYRSLVMKPGHIIQKLYPAISQCKVLDAEVLKTEKPQLVRQLHSLKLQFDKEFQILIERLSSVNQNVLLRGFGGQPTQHQSRKVDTYFMEL